MSTFLFVLVKYSIKEKVILRYTKKKKHKRRTEKRFSRPLLNKMYLLIFYNVGSIN